LTEIAFSAKMKRKGRINSLLFMKQAIVISPCFHWTMSWRRFGQTGPSGSSHGGYDHYYTYGYRKIEPQEPPEKNEVSK
jgi:hypothetical protein